MTYCPATSSSGTLTTSFAYPEEPKSEIASRKITNPDGSIGTTYTQNNITVVNHYHHTTEHVINYPEHKGPLISEETCDIIKFIGMVVATITVIVLCPEDAKNTGKSSRKK